MTWLDALLALLTAPFVQLLAVLAAAATGWVAMVEKARAHRHVFRRHPSGWWHCSTCPATRPYRGANPR